MNINSLIPQLFFYGLLGVSAYTMWLLFSPFFTAFALATVLVVVSYPLYESVKRWVTYGRETLAAAITTILVFALIVTPIFFVSSVLVSEFFSLYQSLESDSSDAVPLLTQGEALLATYLPGLAIDFTDPIKQSAAWLGRSFGAIFSGAVSMAITLLLSILATFYLFKDGRRLVQWLVAVSPLPDKEDNLILERISRAIRATIIGTIALSVIQGVVATSGFAIFGIERAVLWGSLGALGALIPGVGLLGIMVPALIYLFVVGNTAGVIGLAIWAVIAVIVVDNIIGPYLMSRGNALHSFVVLVSVLGGISLFGPIGFIVGPVLVTVFLTLLEIYALYNTPEKVFNGKIKR